MNMWERGFVHYYYGTGKGKSTAAVGLAIRTLGHGGRVYIGQFIKTMRYGDVLFLEQHTKRKECVVELYGSMYGGTGCLIDHAASPQDVQAAEQGLARAVEQMCSGRYDLVIWDEVSMAVGLGLLRVEALIDAIKKRPDECELVLTGRHYCEELLPYCQLVTNFAEVKHYYHEGVLSRTGIEH